MALGPVDLAYRWLHDAFEEHRRVPREPESVTDLGAARARLEDARADMAIARGPMQADPPTPDLVERPRGSASRRAQGAALVSAVVAVAALGFGTWLVGQIQPPVRADAGSVTWSVVEAPSGDCQWLVSFRLLNRSSADVAISGVRSAVDGSARWGRIDSMSLPSGGEANLTSVFSLRACPQPASTPPADEVAVRYSSDGTTLLAYIDVG